MSKRSVGYAASFSQNAKTLCSPELFNKILDHEAWKAAVKKIGENGKDSVKSKLPLFYWNVERFNDEPTDSHTTNHTADNIGGPSGLFMTDYDLDLGDNPQVEDWKNYYDKEISGREEELGIVFSHISIGLHGIHTVAVMPAGMEDIAACQEIQGKALGLKPDEACKDMARGSYAVPRSYVLHNRMEQWFQGDDIKGMEIGSGQLTKPVEFDLQFENPETAEKKQFPDNFKGIPFTEIIQEWWKQTNDGCTPSKGERHLKTLELMRELRYICDNQPEWLLQVVPNYEENENGWRRSAHDVCQYKTYRMPEKLAHVLSSLQSSGEKAEELDWEYQLMPMIPKLPEALRVTLDDVRVGAKFPTLLNCLAIASAYATDITFEWYGQEEHTQLYSIAVGESASGKGQYIGKWGNIYTQLMKDWDREGRNSVKAFKRNLSQKQQEEQQQPHPILRYVAANTTDATLAEKLENVEGKCLLMFTTELESIVKSNNSQWGCFYDVFLKGFHREELNRERVSQSGVDTHVEHTAIALAATTTMVTVKAMFNNSNLVNGLFGRVAFTFLPNDVNQKLQPTKKVTEETTALIKESMQKLSENDQCYEIPHIVSAYSDWEDDQIAKNIENTDGIENVRDELRRRSGLMAARATVIVGAMLGDMKHTLLPEFFTLIADYIVEHQIALYKYLTPQTGGAIEGLPSATLQKQKVDWFQIFNQLPDHFTDEDMKRLAPGSSESTRKNTRAAWKKKEYINSEKQGRKCINHKLVRSID